jgi:hypothetical protein
VLSRGSIGDQYKQAVIKLCGNCEDIRRQDLSFKTTSGLKISLNAPSLGSVYNNFIYYIFTELVSGAKLAQAAVPGGEDAAWSIKVGLAQNTNFE